MITAHGVCGVGGSVLEVNHPLLGLHITDANDLATNGMKVLGHKGTRKGRPPEPLVRERVAEKCNG